MKAEATTAAPTTTTATPPATPAKPDPGTTARAQFFKNLKQGPEQDKEEPKAGPKAEPKTEPKAEPKVEAKTEPKVEHKTEAKTEPVKRTVKVKAVEPSMSPEQIAVVAAKTAAEVLKPSAPPAPEPLLPEVEEKLDLYKQLEEMNATKYPPGLAKRVSQSRKELAKYKSEWEKANPGQTFDIDDPAHDDFVMKNPEIELDDNFPDVIRAESKLEIKRVEDKMRKERETQERAAKAIPESEKASLQADEQVLKAFIPGEVTQKAIDDWRTANPDEFETATSHIMEARQVLKATSLIFDGVEQPNPNSELHGKVFDATLLTQYEALLSTAPKDELVNEQGKNWVPFAKFDAMSDEEKAKHFTTSEDDIASFKRAFLRLPNEEKQKFFTVAKEDVLKTIALGTARKAKAAAQQLIQQSIKVATRLGYAKPSSSTATPPPVAPPAAPAQPTAPAIPPSPSVGTTAPVTSPGVTQRPDTTNNGGAVGIFMRKLRGEI